ncbi:MAG: ImpA family type VI secretion system protein [Gemmataceae bacterium]
MRSDSLLDIPTLVASLPGDAPAGGEVPALVGQQLKKARETKQRDSQTGEWVEKKPEWENIIQIATYQLTNTSKDLPLATRLVEALTKHHGVPGLRDGLHLLGEMVANCWDRMHPLLKPEALKECLEKRSNILQATLSDPDYGVLFPLTVEKMPLVLIDNNPASLHDKKLADRGKGTFSTDKFARAQPLNDSILDDLKEACEQFHSLTEVLDKKLEEEAPNLRKLQEVMEECLGFLKHVVGEPETPPEEEEQESPQKATSNPSPAVPSNEPTAETLYAQLDFIATQLSKLQPNNPAISLIRRAIKIGKMSPGELIEELVRDSAAQADRKREFGVVEPSGDGS